ncbi:hypothetical protein ACLBOM_37180 [Escherichia coli]
MQLTSPCRTGGGECLRGRHHHQCRPVTFENHLDSAIVVNKTSAVADRQGGVSDRCHPGCRQQSGRPGRLSPGTRTTGSSHSRMQ